MDIEFTTDRLKRIAVDVSITTPVQATVKAMDPFTAAGKRAADKKKKHEKPCIERGNEFLPAVFESTGATHESAIQVLRYVESAVKAKD